MNSDPIKTEELSGGVLTKSDGSITSPPSREEINKKFDRVDIILFSVVIILLVMVATLIIDSFHINSVTYREYSEKIENLNSTQLNSKVLADQNIENQKLILQQQAQILQLLNKEK